MKPAESSKSIDAAIRGSLAAMRRAAAAAPKTAIDTGTYIVVVVDGEIRHIGADELRRQQLAAGEGKPESPADER